VSARAGDRVEVRLGLPEGCRPAAAALCYEAFERKFAPILGTLEQGAAILAQGLHADALMVALDGERLVGMIALVGPRRGFFRHRLAPFVEQHGRLRGAMRWLLFGPFAWHRQIDGLTLGAVAVHRDVRGQGVGTRLVQAALAHAREQGFDAVSLGVIDTNPGARRLYERLGFEARATHHYPFLRRWLGFGASTQMIHQFGSA